MLKKREPLNYLVPDGSAGFSSRLAASQDMMTFIPPSVSYTIVGRLFMFYTLYANNCIIMQEKLLAIKGKQNLFLSVNRLVKKIIKAAGLES